jgi:hypothetical protein
MIWIGGAFSAPSADAQGTSREQLDDYMSRLVTEIRASVPDIGSYEPFLVLHVLHDERGYRVQASDLLERRFTTALAEQRVRVIDQQARQRILEELEACYTEDAPFCRASDVVGRFQTAGGIFEGSVLPVRGGTEFRAKLVVATGAAELSPGEILGTWSVVIPPPSLDPVEDLLPAAGAVSYGAFRSDTLGPEALGELRIDVRTQDGTPAWVNIDGEINVPAPATTTMGGGRHLVTITAPGHRPFSGYVEIIPRGIVQREIILARGEGQIWVRSSALEAVVLLDGERVGTTPWRGKEVETGPHTVRIEREGYEPYEQEFILEHEQVKDIYAELRELPGDIVVTCLQDDVAVFMDDLSRGPVGSCSTGRTLTVKDVPAGRHVLWGVRGSDRTSRVNVVVRGGQAVPLSLNLRLDPSGEVRDANAGRASEEELYEPFGGYRWRSGPYVNAGFIVGQASFDLDLPGSGASGSYNVIGLGGQVAIEYLFDPFKINFGLDFIYFDEFAGFGGTRRYHEIFLGLTYDFMPRSSIRPYIGGRGSYTGLSLDEGGDGGAELTSNVFGGGVFGGIVARLGRSATLELGAGYSMTGTSDLKLNTDGDTVVGRVENWSLISGFISASFHVGPG